MTDQKRDELFNLIYDINFRLGAIERQVKGFIDNSNEKFIEYTESKQKKNKPRVDQSGRYVTEPEDGKNIWLASGYGEAVCVTYDVRSSVYKNDYKEGRLFISEKDLLAHVERLKTAQKIREIISEVSEKDNYIHEDFSLDCDDFCFDFAKLISFKCEEASQDQAIELIQDRIDDYKLLDLFKYGI